MPVGIVLRGAHVVHAWDALNVASDSLASLVILIPDVRVCVHTHIFTPFSVMHNALYMQLAS